MKKLIFIFVAIFALCSCSKDEEFDNYSFIPNGTYVEINGSLQEKMTIVINGNHICWYCYSYGQYYEEEFNYKLEGNIMIIIQNGYEVDRTHWYINGNYLTIGEIEYLKQ